MNRLIIRALGWEKGLKRCKSPQNVDHHKTIVQDDIVQLETVKSLYGAKYKLTARRA